MEFSCHGLCVGLWLPALSQLRTGLAEALPREHQKGPWAASHSGPQGRRYLFPCIARRVWKRQTNGRRAGAGKGKQPLPPPPTGWPAGCLPAAFCPSALKWPLPRPTGSSCSCLPGRTSGLSTQPTPGVSLTAFHAPSWGKEGVRGSPLEVWRHPGTGPRLVPGAPREGHGRLSAFRKGSPASRPHGPASRRAGANPELLLAPPPGRPSATCQHTQTPPATAAERGGRTDCTPPASSFPWLVFLLQGGF